MSYAAPTTYAAPQMSYVPQATMGGYPGYGAATHSPYLDATTITQQEKDATEALNGQASMQQEMELNMAKQQRLMAISQQAASMQGQAQQYKLQMEMQQKMSTLYSGAGAAGAAKDTKPATDKKPKA